MSATATAHPAALAGTPRMLFVASMLTQFVAFALLVTGCVFLYGSWSVLSAGAICVSGALAFLAGVWIREQSWAKTPSDAETYRTPAWVIVVNEAMGLLTLVALIVGMSAIGTVEGFGVALFVIFAATGSSVVMAIRSTPEARTVRVVRTVGIGAIGVGTVAVTVIAEGGLDEVSTGSAVAGLAVLTLFAGIGAICTFAYGRGDQGLSKPKNARAVEGGEPK